MIDLPTLRKSYERAQLNEEASDADPLRQFERWLAEAIAAQLPEPNAMTLATVDAGGRPSARVVLLKELDDRGFVFYTNYASRKGEALAANPVAALVFFWPVLDRQIRIEGAVERVTAAESDAYFQVRPRASRVAAIASPQSQVLASRHALEARLEAVEHELAGADPYRPAHWGGYRVVPDDLEFWQGQPSRLHDRVVYKRVDGAWSRMRLAP